MEKLTDWLKQFVESKWNYPSGLLASLLGELFFLSLFFWNNFDKKQKISQIEWSMILFAMAITLGYWLITNAYYKKKSKGKIGIVIAIKADGKKESIRLKDDFIYNLNQEIQPNNSEDIFEIITLSQYQSSKITGYHSSIRALKKSRSQFILYGTCKIRNLSEYYLELNATVIHNLIPQDVSNVFSKEMSEVIQRKIKFQEKEEIEGFNLTKDIMKFGISYIIGIAAYLSGDSKLSLKIFQETKEKIKNQQLITPEIKIVKNRINAWIERNCEVQLIIKSQLFRNNKNEKYILESKYFLDELNKVRPNNYRGHLLRAIWFFLIDKNVKDAKKEIQKARNFKDLTWRYSEAFLLAYEGKLDEADKKYERILNTFVEPQTMFEIEDFIHYVLEKEPEKYQLWYCLGLINLFGKGDIDLANQAFSKFISSCKDGDYAMYKAKAESLIINE